MSNDKNQMMLVNMAIAGLAPIAASSVVNHDLFLEAQKRLVELDEFLTTMLEGLRDQQTAVREAMEAIMSAEGIETALRGVGTAKALEYASPNPSLGSPTKAQDPVT